jgi:glycine/D-amino acid oxidase-like deaminating enzyme
VRAEEQLRADLWIRQVTPDMQGILGADPVAPTGINACGFSGHGLMQAPVIGRLVAEEISKGHITSFDVEGLRLDRFARTTRLDRAKRSSDDTMIKRVHPHP